MLPTHSHKISFSLLIFGKVNRFLCRFERWKRYPLRSRKSFVEEKICLRGLCWWRSFQKRQSRGSWNMYVSSFEVNLCRMWEKMNSFCYCVLFYYMNIEYKCKIICTFIFYYVIYSVNILFNHVSLHLTVTKKCSILFRNIVCNFLKF